MSKPLTIEELKTLPVGEWVWVIFTWTKWQGEYMTIDNLCVCDSSQNEYLYSDYGKTWVAYKNKEQAEGKSISLPYLLCTSSKFACVIWQEGGKIHKSHTVEIDRAKRFLKEKENNNGQAKRN